MLKLKAKQSVFNHKYLKNFKLDSFFLSLFPLLSSKQLGFPAKADKIPLLGQVRGKIIADCPPPGAWGSLIQPPWLQACGQGL